MGAYSRWALIRGWALIRINTVVTEVGFRQKIPNLKGHGQLMHMRIRYHFLADLHVTGHARET